MSKKIGLALGSGGARGFAHIGVLKVLEENNIKIDYIAGSSIGAIVGALYASGKTVKDLVELVESTDWKRLVSLLDPHLTTGLLHGEKIQHFFEEYIGDLDFSDLKIPFASVATDYHNGDAVVFRSGKVSPAIRASMSVPLAFKPFEYEDKLLLDGGMSVPVPVDIVREMGADVVLAINLDGSYFSEVEKKLNFAEIAYRSFNMYQYNLSKQLVQRADVIVTPKVGHILWYKFISGKETLTAGEDAMRSQMHLLKQKIEL